MERTEHIFLWTAQTQTVLDNLERKGISYVKKRYIEDKYGSVSWIFQTAYSFMCKKLAQSLDKPPEAETPVWLYYDAGQIALSPEVKLLRLEVPVKEVLLFDARKWTDILNLSYVGAEEEKRVFEQEMQRQGIRTSSEVFSSPFYPLWKNKIVKSWDKVLEMDENFDKRFLQGAAWYLKKEWIRKPGNEGLQHAHE